MTDEGSEQMPILRIPNTDRTIPRAGRHETTVGREIDAVHQSS